MRKKNSGFWSVIDGPLDIILIPIYILFGMIYITIRYPKAKRDEALQADYDGSYALVGKFNIVKLILIVFASIMLFMIVLLIIAIIKMW